MKESKGKNKCGRKKYTRENQTELISEKMQLKSYCARLSAIKLSTSTIQTKQNNKRNKNELSPLAQTLLNQIETKRLRRRDSFERKHKQTDFHLINPLK